MINGLLGMINELFQFGKLFEQLERMHTVIQRDTISICVHYLNGSLAFFSQSKKEVVGIKEMSHYAQDRT